jgi:hypothetical protein
VSTRFTSTDYGPWAGGLNGWKDILWAEVPSLSPQNYSLRPKQFFL